MFSSQEDVLFSDLHLKDDTSYFLYIGELKADCLNQFVGESLSRIHQRRFECISILPDVVESYPHKNILVINPLAKKLYSETGRKYSCRMSAGDFAAVVSRSKTVLELVELLVSRQGRLFIHVFESLPQLELARIPGTVLLAPTARWRPCGTTSSISFRCWGGLCRS